MGRKSTKENKNIYQLSRENAGLTRAAASEKMDYISANRIEKIENESSLPQPDEILAMSECYKVPTLCNYFCSHECPIGQISVPEITLKDIAQITLEMMVNLCALSKEKDRLAEILVDGRISDEEIKDFERIQDSLDKMSLTINSFKLWVQEKTHRD